MPISSSRNRSRLGTSGIAAEGSVSSTSTVSSLDRFGCPAFISTASSLVQRMQFFAHVSDQAKQRRPETADLYARVSTHWMRHTSLTHQADAGIELRYLNRNARHANLETTGIYLHAADDKWHSAMRRHRLHPDKSKR